MSHAERAAQPTALSVPQGPIPMLVQDGEDPTPEPGESDPGELPEPSAQEQAHLLRLPVISAIRSPELTPAARVKIGLPQQVTPHPEFAEWALDSVRAQKQSGFSIVTIRLVLATSPARSSARWPAWSSSTPRASAA